MYIAFMVMSLASCGQAPDAPCDAKKQEILEQWGGAPDIDRGLIFTFVDVQPVTYTLTPNDEGCLVRINTNEGGLVPDFPDMP